MLPLANSFFDGFSTNWNIVESGVEHHKPKPSTNLNTESLFEKDFN